MRNYTGFVTSIIWTIFCIVLYIALSPAFVIAKSLYDPTNRFASPLLTQGIDFATGSGWIMVVGVIIISNVILWFLQTFRREEQNEEFMR